MILRPDDFQIGMFVTVAEASEFTGYVHTMDGPTAVAMTNRNGMGMVMQVKAIELPYVAVHFLANGRAVVGMQGIDTRAVKLMKVSDEYVNAVVGPPVVC